MTKRAEALAEQRAKHRFRALVLNIMFMAVAVALIALMAVMATHWPRMLAEEGNVEGDWSANVTTEWHYLLVEHTYRLDPDLGMVWEITEGEENETIAEGNQNESRDDVIAPRMDPGDYRVFLMPDYRPMERKYDVTVRESYVHPDTAWWGRVAGAFFALVFAPIVMYTFMWPHREKWGEEYRLAWRFTLPLLVASSAAIAAVPWF